MFLIIRHSSLSQIQAVVKIRKTQNDTIAQGGAKGY